MTLDDLDGRLFAEVPEAAAILGRDERTIRRAAAAGDIPATRVGKQYLIPTEWLRQQAGIAAPTAPALPDLDELVDRLADRFFARFALQLGGTSREVA